MFDVDYFINYCVNNPDKTGEDLMKEFNLEEITACYIIREASKKL